MAPPHFFAMKTYSISQIARTCGLSRSTLLYYDRLGLLRPGRTASGYRIYRERDLERLDASLTAGRQGPQGQPLLASHPVYFVRVMNLVAKFHGNSSSTLSMTNSKNIVLMIQSYVCARNLRARGN